MSLITKILKYTVRFLSIAIPSALMVLAVIAPKIYDFHPLLVAPYYAMMWWTAGLVLLFRRSTLDEIEALLTQRLGNKRWPHRIKKRRRNDSRRNR